MQPTKDELIEQVRVNLLRYMERNKFITMHIIASDIHYSYDTVVKFVNGSITTLPVANALVRAYPELGHNLVCPGCGRLNFEC